MKQLSLVLVALFSMSVFAEEAQHGGALPDAAVDALSERSGLSKEKFEKFKTYLKNACAVDRSAPQRSPGIVPNTPAAAATGTGTAPDTTTSSATDSTSSINPGTSSSTTDGASLVSNKCTSCHASKGRSAEIAAIQRGRMTNGPTISSVLNATELAAVKSFLGI